MAPPSTSAADPLLAQTGLTAEGRSERARAAAQARWSTTTEEERLRISRVLREATLGRFEREVDPAGELPPDTRRELAEVAWREHLRTKARVNWARMKALQAAGMTLPDEDDDTIT